MELFIFKIFNFFNLTGPKTIQNPCHFIQPIDINCRYTPANVLHKFHNTWVFTRFFHGIPPGGTAHAHRGNVILVKNIPLGLDSREPPGPTW